MKKETLKKVAITAGIVLTGFAFISWDKAQKMKHIFSQFDIKPHRISNYRITPTKQMFNLDVIIINPTTDNFNLTSFGFATITEIRLFLKKQYLGAAKVNLSQIKVPNNNSLIIRDIPIEVMNNTLLVNAPNLTSIGLKDLNVEAVVKIGTSTYTIAS